MLGSFSGLGVVDTGGVCLLKMRESLDLVLLFLLALFAIELPNEIGLLTAVEAAIDSLFLDAFEREDAGEECAIFSVVRDMTDDDLTSSSFGKLL